VAAEDWPRVTAIGELLQCLDNGLARKVWDDGRLEKVIAEQMRRGEDPLGSATSDFVRYDRQVADDALSGHHDALRAEVDRLSKLLPGPKQEAADPQALGIAFAMLGTGFTEADVVSVLGYMPSLDTTAVELDEMARQMDDNPEGLSTFDPMEDPRYRAVARRVVDRFLREHGLPPLTWPEDKR
jgi:hypothetical protein